MNGETAAPPTSKACTKCGETKSLDDFHRDKRGRYERQSSCKECDAAYRKANKEALAAQKAAYYEANKEAIAAQQAAYRKANKEAIAARMAASRDANAARTDEQVAAKRTELRPRGVKRCRRCLDELPLSRFSDDRGTADGLSNTCRACDNRGLRTIAEPYWLAHGIDPNICGWCGAPSAHVDHVKPLALGGTDTPENLIPACAPCNLSKNARVTHVWITEHVDPANEDAWLIDPHALNGATVTHSATSVFITGQAVAYEAA